MKRAPTNWKNLLTRETELDSLLTSIVSELRTYFETDRAAVILKDESGAPKVIEGGYGWEVNAVSHELIEVAEQKKETVLIGRLDESRKHERILREARSEILVPLLENSYLVGLLVMGNKVSGRYKKRDLALLRVLAKESAEAIQSLEFCEESQRLNERLRREIGKAATELKVANEHLEELTAEKERFISDLSCQLRCSLTRIRECVASAAESSNGLGREERERLGEALSNSKNLLKAFDDLVIASGTAQHLQITPVDFALDDLIFHVLREEKPKAEGKDIDLSYLRQNGPLPAVRADPDKLKLALSNLIDGALGSARKGSVVIETKNEDCEIIVSVSQSGSDASETDLSGEIRSLPLEVEAEDLLRRYQALGFLASKRIIEAHKGRMWVETEGAGHAVRFSLPVG